MDIELLSRMIGELIVEHDQVGLPGLGTFVAEMVPASFSDKGYTIHPPYRRLSFRSARTEDCLLIDFYAESNQIDRESASAYLTQYLTELKSILEERKSVTLPGLGRLRATRENALFFVPDEELDIFPEGIGLRPVSLKSLTHEEDPVVINVPPPAPARSELPEAAAEEPEPAAPDIPEPEAAEEPELTEPAAEAAAEPTAKPAVEPAAEPTAEPTAEPEAEAAADSGGKRYSPWLLALVILTALVLLALIVFLILARVAPAFVDSLLYSPEELEILKY